MTLTELQKANPHNHFEQPIYYRSKVNTSRNLGFNVSHSHGRLLKATQGSAYITINSLANNCLA
jgi:hypothetical protein